jgi:cation diffusion facilitator CzcD-associated flavoprotein CzcO
MPTWSQVLGYLRHVASRFDMRHDIEFQSRVCSPHYDEASRRWTVSTEDGRSYGATYLVSASGLLSVACAPPFPGLAPFEGETYVSSAWPTEPASFRGKGGQTVKAKWEAGPRTHLGITIDGFPKLFILSGPHSPFANIPPVIDAAVTWIGRAIDHARRRGCDSIEPTPTAVEAWTRQVRQLLDLTLLGQGERVHSWFLGANVPGKARSPFFYFVGAGAYFDDLAKSADAGFADFVISGA